MNIPLRAVVGSCPMCIERGKPAVIYRRSHKSVTMRCNKCGLQWTMTLARIHKAASKQATFPHDDLSEQLRDAVKAGYQVVAADTEYAACVAAARGRGARSRMEQLERRKVIRLGSQ